jgi:hypothetical protein
MKRWLKNLKRGASGQMLSREEILAYKPKALKVPRDGKGKLVGELIRLATRGDDPLLRPTSNAGEYFQVKEAAPVIELHGAEERVDEENWREFVVAIAPRDTPISARDVARQSPLGVRLDNGKLLPLLRSWCTCANPRLVEGVGGFNYTEHGLALRREVHEECIVRIRRATKLGEMLSPRDFDIFARFDEVTRYAALLHPAWQSAMFLGHYVDGFSVNELADEFGIDRDEAQQHLKNAVRRVQRRINKIVYS